MEKLCDTGTTSQELEEASLTEAFQASPGKALASKAEESPLHQLGNYLGTQQSISPSTICSTGGDQKRTKTSNTFLLSPVMH